MHLGIPTTVSATIISEKPLILFRSIDSPIPIMDIDNTSAIQMRVYFTDAAIMIDSSSCTSKHYLPAATIHYHKLYGHSDYNFCSAAAL